MSVRRRVVGLALIGFVVFVVGGHAATAAPRNDFVMPSRNIFCHYEASLRYLRCDVLSGLRPQPRRRCALDWTGIGIGPRSRPMAICAGDTVANQRAPVLAYGRTWRRGALRCRSSRDGLRCRNAGRHGFFLARERWRIW
jgi:hypothetical protein